MKQENLFAKVHDKLQELETITRIKKDIIKKDIKDNIKKISQELPEIIKAEKQLIKDNDTLKIGIIGQVKSGKSSFLNALLFEGKDLLPKASTPMTAGLTVISYGEQPKFKVEYYSREDWETIEVKAKEFDSIYNEIKNSGEFEDEKSIVKATKERAGDLINSSKELVERCGLAAKNKIGKEAYEETLYSIDELQGQLNQYVGANGEYTSVTKTLYLYLPEEGLKGVEIVDTPGINDPIVSREERTNEFLRSCHGVFLLSYSGQFCSNTDMTFLKERVYDQGISSVVVLGSKFDSGLLDIARTANGDLGFAVNYLSNSLKDGLREAFSKKNFSQNLPKIDYNSGLCYSIYKKDEKDWDETEAHMAKVLTKNYPDFEGNKELFNALANIDGIQEDYIEKEFIVNKERIIAEKKEAFTESNKLKILNTVNYTKGELLRDKKNIESYNSDDIEIQKESSSVIKSLGKRSESVITNMIKEVNVLDQSFLNQIQFDTFDNRSYIVNREREVVDRQGFFRLRKRYNYSIRLVDSSLLKENLKNFFKQETQKISHDWIHYFSKEGPIIKNFESEIIKLLKSLNASIDPDLFQDALNNVLKAISRQAATFPTSEIENFYNNRVNDRIKNPNRNNWKITFEKNESPTEILESKAEQERNNYSSIVNNIISDFKTEVQNNIRSQKNLIKSEIEKLKTTFESEVEKKFNEILEKLQEAIQDKEANIQAIVDGVQILEEIESLFNNRKVK